MASPRTSRPASQAPPAPRKFAALAFALFSLSALGISAYFGYQRYRREHPQPLPNVIAPIPKNQEEIVRKGMHFIGTQLLDLTPEQGKKLGAIWKHLPRSVDELVDFQKRTDDVLTTGQRERLRPIPTGYFTFRSRTYGVFVFWRGFFQDPNQLEGPVSVMEKTRIYPFGSNANSKPMEFPDASGVPINMLYPTDGSAFDMLKRYIESEYVDPADLDMRGMLAAIGIVKGQPFVPDGQQRGLLDKAARSAAAMGKCITYEFTGLQPGGLWWTDRQYVNGFPSTLTPEFQSPTSTPTYNNTFLRSGFYSVAYSASPAMALNLVGIGAKYCSSFKDANGTYLSGNTSYVMHMPPRIPAKIFWSVTVYDAANASGLDNGQPFPSINTMDKPVFNPDSSIDIYFGPKSPGEGKNWLATVPEKGFFVCLRLYGPTEAFFDQTWKPGDVEKIK